MQSILNNKRNRLQVGNNKVTTRKNKFIDPLVFWKTKDK